MLRLKSVNKKIQEKYPDLELIKGDAYFYFFSTNEKIYGLECTSVYVYKLNDLTLEQWIKEAKNINDQLEAE